MNENIKKIVKNHFAIHSMGLSWTILVSCMIIFFSVLVFDKKASEEFLKGDVILLYSPIIISSIMVMMISYIPNIEKEQYIILGCSRKDLTKGNLLISFLLVVINLIIFWASILYRNLVFEKMSISEYLELVNKFLIIQSSSIFFISIIGCILTIISKKTENINEKETYKFENMFIYIFWFLMIFGGNPILIPIFMFLKPILALSTNFVFTIIYTLIILMISYYMDYYVQARKNY